MTTKTDPAMRAAETLKPFLRKVPGEPWQDTYGMVADIIRRETRCDEMRRLLAEAYNLSDTPRYSMEEWITRTQSILEADQ